MKRDYLMNPLLAVHEPGEWVLAEDIWLIDPVLGALCARKCFITDLASIPQIAKSVFDVNGKHRIAAIFHDFAYCRPSEFGITERKQADDLFLRLLLLTGVNKATANVMYSSVRAGGWIYWNRRRRDPLAIQDFVWLDYFD